MGFISGGSTGEYVLTNVELELFSGGEEVGDRTMEERRTEKFGTSLAVP